MSQEPATVGVMRNHLRFYLNRLRERLWIKPLATCILSVIAVFVAGLADRLDLPEYSFPDISLESLKKLLTVTATSMLVMAALAVGAMLSAYQSASNTATPRTFSLVIADDVSQNALSTFIGVFIFSIVSLTALLNDFFETDGRFLLFLFTTFAFAIVILSFVRWVDRIARLGRLGTTIDKVEEVTAAALRSAAQLPTLGAVKTVTPNSGIPVCSKVVGYVQHIDIAKLQTIAERMNCRIVVAVLPGSFSTPVDPLAYIQGKDQSDDEISSNKIIQAFRIRGERTFDEDPRFGLVVLSEIASRALSPSVNDPGTAIDIIGTQVRLFALWAETRVESSNERVEFDRVAIPELSLDDMFDDAFNAISRDGATILEVTVRLQKAFYCLARLGHDEMRETAVAHAKYAFRHAELGLKLKDDLEILRAVTEFSLREVECDARQDAAADSSGCGG
ncbi:DUF2254 domain-containing protein [Nitrosomonas marina]|uniref:Uncharacterized membrane protein n=1 Tax=Nitrosomonas marina TaxID=917 RepID=A0A1H8AAP0_9PROT|nr:DUF2254 domain-containing protein [Nitrosomonas marina]SEM67641.1 Uncharacterized membrane protein [Nitrosomonas marina]